MLDKLLSLIPNEKKRNVAYAVGGMATLLSGNKVLALGMFAKGAQGLEKLWREAHPHVPPGMDARWNHAIHFYESTHMNGVNRKLHMVGIPFIVGGAAGLLLFSPFRPLWLMSASSFAGGWVLNIVGHSVFEKNAPAFADDPLSFIAGPIWDVQQMFGVKADLRDDDNVIRTADGDVTIINVEPLEPALA